ncbi:FUSC family protein [Pseudonocardia sp. RS11V-5]|uniref:FUSC family protein n=1 Tax=Pseudonocardia terrae TaxID=2905831 RepID=UPI001E3939C3|nr:FUSC family protein [Pseudonocardia terrae]MCE3550350.1 FUSC family protein [Pseudonocardia terrae]
MQGTLVRELVRFEAHAGAHRPALRCGISVGVPMLVLLVLGRLDLLGAATFGAFAAIYGRNLTVPARTQVQALTGLGLVASVAFGLLAAHLPASPWLALLVLVGVAVAGTIGGEVVGWKPGGPLFFVFAAGAFAGAHPLGLAAALQVVAVAAGSAAFAVVVGSAGALLPGHVRRRAPLLAVPLREAARREIVLEVLLACAVTAPLAVLLGVDHVYWALVAAVVPLSVTGSRARVNRGVMRIGGTLGGLAVAAALLALHLPGWAIVVAAVALQTAAELLVMRNYAVALLFITPLALVVGTTMHPVPTGTLLTDRLVATVAGVLVALAVLGLRARRRRRRTAPAPSAAASCVLAP